MKNVFASISILLFCTSLFGQEKVNAEKLKSQHRIIHTEIIIDATPEQVWEVLTDFESYPSWAIFFKGMKGEIKDKGKVEAFFKMKEKKKKIQEAEHTIFYEEGKRFGWSEKAILGIKDNHQFIVEATNDGKTRFIQSDEFRKGGTWLIGRYLTNLMKKKYPEFNRSLKAEVEKRYSK